jgi:hypothetical protein
MASTRAVLALLGCAVGCVVLSGCAALDKFFGGQPGDPNTAPMHDLVTGSDDPNSAQPMFAHRLDAGPDAPHD